MGGMSWIDWANNEGRTWNFDREGKKFVVFGNKGVGQGKKRAR